MEIILESRLRSLGLDEDWTGLRDLDYMSSLSQFRDCVGFISEASFSQLDEDRKKQVSDNILFKTRVCGRFDESYFLYSIKTIEPVLYEAYGYKGLISFKSEDDRNIQDLNPFVYENLKYSQLEFDKLEHLSNYLICTFYDGGASFLYLSDSQVDNVLDKFQAICVKESGKTLEVDIYEPSTRK